MKLGAGFGCMFLNPLASNHLLLYSMAHAALPSAYSTIEFTNYLVLWGHIWKTCAKCTAGKQGVCQYQKVYKYFLKCFPCGIGFTFGSLKVSLSFVWYKYLRKGPSIFPVLHLQKKSSSMTRRIYVKMVVSM